MVPGCLVPSRLRPASSLFIPLGSSVVVVLDEIGCSVDSADSFGDDSSVEDGSCVASVLEGSACPGFLRDKSGFTLLT